MRYAEVVLNKAEAQACAGSPEAAQTIGAFVATRYIIPPTVPAGKDDLIRFIRNERRKELCFEGHRWFDLRRYAVSTALAETVEIVHKYHATVSSVTAIRGEYRLKPYSAQTKGSWIFPINDATVDYCYPNIENYDRLAGVEVEVYE